MNKAQKTLVQRFILEHPEYDITHIYYFDGKVDVYFRDSYCNPWNTDQMGNGCAVRTALEKLERQLGYVK